MQLGTDYNPEFQGHSKAYAIAVTFEAARKLENTIVWNTHANAKIRITERSIFDKFFKKKIIQNF
jgi:hypothetical protein